MSKTSSNNLSFVFIVGCLAVFVSLAPQPAAAHHSWFSRTWRKITGQSNSNDQCLVSCTAKAGIDDTGVCNMMWGSLSEILTGVAEIPSDAVLDAILRDEGTPKHLRNRRQAIQNAISVSEQREAKRKICCFLTSFPQAVDKCCSLLKHYCNSIPYDTELDQTETHVDKVKSMVSSVANKIGVDIDLKRRR